jgi:S-adenosyl methyltransferase
VSDKTSSAAVPASIDTSVPHSARVYDYWLGGKDNFAADRELGDRFAAAFPPIRSAARENRAFLRRSVRYLAAEVGVRQFLDLGTGIPSADNTHEVAQAEAPESRIVYVDNDPVVLVHARALLTTAPAGATAYVDADLRDVETVLAAARDVFDVGRPVAVTALQSIQFVVDGDEARDLIARYLAAFVPGSYLVLSTPTLDFLDAAVARNLLDLYERAGTPFCLRRRDEIARFFDGLELVEPGFVPLAQWRREEDSTPAPEPSLVPYYAGVGRVPGR